MFTNVKLIQELIRDLAGKNTEVIVNLLINKKNVNEFKLAEKLNLTINQTRNILYKLYAQNILYFIRKKDKRKGWYVYYYTLNIGKSLEKLIELKKKEIENLTYQLRSREKKRFFSCSNGCMELNEESALLYNFSCPECGILLQLTSPVQIVADIKVKIEVIQKEISYAQKELDVINIKEVKIKERKINKDKKERAEARRAKRLLKLKEKKREERREQKKKGKKVEPSLKKRLKKKKSVNKTRKAGKKPAQKKGKGKKKKR